MPNCCSIGGIWSSKELIKHWVNERALCILVYDIFPYYTRKQRAIAHLHI